MKLKKFCPLEEPKEGASSKVRGIAGAGVERWAETESAGAM